MNWLILTLLLLPIVPAQAQSSAPAKALAKKGASLMSQNKVDAAIDSYTRAIELSPNYADAYVQRGLAKRAKGDLAGSINDYEKAASIDPKSIVGNRYVAETYSNRGYIKLNAFDVDSAIEDFTKAIDVNSKDHQALYRRGYARLLKEELTAALNDFNTALSIAGQYNFSKVLIYAARGMVKLLQGNNADAQKDFDECSKLNIEEPFDLGQHLRSLEVEIQLMRERRAKQQKTIARVGFTAAGRRGASDR